MELLYTGCRVGEAMNLQWCDVGVDRVTLWHTKSGKPRTIPLVAKAKEAVQIVQDMGKDSSPSRAATTPSKSIGRMLERKRG
jgi:integrase